MKNKTFRYLEILFAVFILFSIVYIIYPNLSKRSVVLNAFTSTNNGMKEYLKNIDDENSKCIWTFVRFSEHNPARVKDYYDRAKECTKISDSIYKYIEKLKNKIIEDNGGFDENGNLRRKYNLFSSARSLVNMNDGDELYKKILATRVNYISILKNTGFWGESDVICFLPNIILDAKPPDKNVNWVHKTFYGLPAIAVITTLTKIQCDIRVSQSNIIHAILYSIPSDGGFDSLVPIVNAEKTTVLVGERYECKVFLAYYGSKRQDQIFINGKEYELTYGMAEFHNMTKVRGTYDFPGKIIKKDIWFGVKEYPFHIRYEVIDTTKK